MNKLLIFFIMIFPFCSLKSFESPEEITLETLAQDVDSQFLTAMKEVLEKIQTRTLLEFGMSYATKYFLTTCHRVVSVEVITHGYGPNRMQNMLQFYRDFSNWIPIAFFSGHRGDVSWAPYKYLGSDAVYVAGSYQCATHLSYEKIDPFYLKELEEFISNLVKFNKIEVILIHPILFLRGDLVRLSFHKIPVIVAYHTNARYDAAMADPWGYKRVETPDEYEEIAMPTNPGTTVWVIKEPKYQDLIEALKTL